MQDSPATNATFMRVERDSVSVRAMNDGTTASGLTIVMSAVNARGTTIVWVEHVLRVLTAVATRLVCLADGRVIADGEPERVLAHEEVRAAFLGGVVL